jgi:adenosylcobinamide kinase / adenosylcobinamide-phosphate guanylyltransferase
MAVIKGRTVFVIGGARSGKSTFALEKAGSFPGKKAYIATAEPLDDEMKKRIERHRVERGGDWETFEEPVKIARVLKEMGSGFNAAVIDCLTLWLSNLLLGTEDPEEEIESFLASLGCGGHPPLFVVSNEVGMGIVPDNALSRRFRDLAGHLNQKVAAIADEVYLVTAGIPVRIKPWE